MGTTRGWGFAAGSGKARGRRACLAILAGFALLVSACGTKTFYSRSQPTARDIGCSDTNEQPVAVVQGITSGEYGWVCGRPPSCRGGQEVVWARTGATRDYDSANQYVVEGKCVPKCGDGEERTPKGDCLATRPSQNGGGKEELTCAEASTCLERRCAEPRACVERCTKWQLNCAEASARNSLSDAPCVARGEECTKACGGGACFQRCFQLQSACRDQAIMRGE